MRLSDEGMIKVGFFCLLLVLQLSSGTEESGTCSADSEDANCRGEPGKPPLKNQNKWKKYLDLIDKAMDEYDPCESEDCSCYQGLIDSDLEPFRAGITKDVIRDTLKAIPRSVHYQIIDHKLYRTENCMFEPRCKGIDHFILEVLPSLPDMEFVLNDRDYPQVNRHLPHKRPVFSFSKTGSYLDILYPAWSFWAGGPAISLHPTGIGRWDQLREKINRAGKERPWTKKESKAFFRGSRTSAERDPLVLLSRDKPHLADAQYTKNQAWKSDKDTLGAKPASEVSFEDHCTYKYLFNFRGVAASFRFKHLFLCQSVVFHVGEEWNEFFYFNLKPWLHYIPVPTHLSNVEELLNFAQQNDDVVRKIARRGYEFVWNHLRPEHVSCYWRKLLSKYSSLLRYKVKRDTSLKSVS